MQTLSQQTLKIFWQHAMRYKVALFLTFLGMAGTTIGEVVIPVYVKKVVDAMAQGIRDPQAYSFLFSILIGWYVFSWIFRRVQEFANIYFQTHALTDLMNSCFDYLHNHSFTFFQNNFVGSLVKKVNRYTRSFEDLSDEIVYRVGRTVMMLVGILVILLRKNTLLFTGFLVWILIFFIANLFFSKYKVKYDLERAAADTRTTGLLADTVTNNINIKLFTAQVSESKSFRQTTEALRRIRSFTWNLSAMLDGIQSFLLYILEFFIIFASVYLWRKGSLTIGDFAQIQAYWGLVLMKVWDIGRFIRRAYENMADANEMTEILLTPHAVQDKQNAATLSVASGSIDFTDVRFAYHDKQPVFKNFTLHINPGERVALVGSSGGGKTTIVKLLFRFYDIQRGTICIDGQNIAHVTQDSLRQNLSLVPQEPILFHRSLFENIRYGKPQASTAEVMQAAKLAHCHEFISRFPDKYETLVGERGVKLSGGERQRVAIARAILKNAPILVLDEATSSLDSESEMYIQDALKTLMLGKTTIVIAHRLSTIMQMDRILVLENGRVSEEGTHKELLKTKQGTYQKLWHIQAGGFNQT